MTSINMIVEQFDKVGQQELDNYIAILTQSVQVHRELLKDTRNGDPQDQSTINKCKKIIRGAEIELDCIKVYNNYKL